MKKITIIGTIIITCLVFNSMKVFGWHFRVSGMETPGELENIIGNAGDWESIDSITVTGNMFHEDFFSFCACSYFGNLKYVDISNAKVENNKIPDYAFYLMRHQGSYGRSKFEEIRIPDEIDEIGKFAFAQTQIKDFKFPKNLTKLNYASFQGCRELEIDLVLPDCFTEIPECAFQYCKSLKSFKLPPNVTYIGRWAFSFCISLTELDLSGKLSFIDIDAFDSCFGLTQIVIPDNVERMGFYAFGGAISCESATIGKGLTQYTGSVIKNCVSLKTAYVNCNIPYGFNYTQQFGRYPFFEEHPILEDVIYGEGVEYIKEDIFDKDGYGDPGIKRLYFPSTLNTLGEGALYERERLEEIECKAVIPPLALNPRVNGDGQEELYSAFGGKLSKDVIVYVPKESLDAYKNDPAWKYFHDFRAIEDPSDVMDIIEDYTDIKTYGSKVFISGKNMIDALPGAIYEISGQIVDSFQFSGVYESNQLTPGIYIVRVGSNVKKIKI